MDTGHELLIIDLETLLGEARDYQFHDFKNSLYPAPKVELVAHLDSLRKSVIEGRYDNKS